MNDQNIELQAKMYVYDLNNCASEFGFKTDEGWEINMATLEQKTYLEKKYFPTLSAKVMPEMLAQLLGSVKFKLNRPPQGLEKRIDSNSIQEQHLEYLVAYSPNRLRG